MARRINTPSSPRRAVPRRGSSSFLRGRPPLPVNGYLIEIISPAQGYIAHTLTPIITVRGTSDTAAPVDIQVEWRLVAPVRTSPGANTWIPAPTQTNELLDIPSGSNLSVQPPGPLSYKEWYYRARAGDKDANIWSDWTASARYLEVAPVIGSVTKYIDLNVGVTHVTPGAVAYMELNVGVGPFDQAQPFAFWYSDLNVGVRLDQILAAAYSDLNVYIPTGSYATANYADMNVTSERPTPHIWWIRPEQGREGYLFNIFGHGFGSVQGQYDGLVYLGGLLCPVIRWTLVSPESRDTVVRAAGTQATGTTSNNMPRVALNGSTVTLAAGDYIEYDLYQETATNAVLPTAYLSVVNQFLGSNTGSLINDTDGVPWATAPAAALEAWHHRRFNVPSGWVGRTLSLFSLGWYGAGGQTQMTASVRSFVIRAADGTPKLWVMGDDKLSTPSLVYTPYQGSVLTSATYAREGDTIIHGQGLDPDVITPEHGWITVIVPQGAVSAMVKVVLEG